MASRCPEQNRGVDVQGRLPLLAPMSEIAGRMAVQAGAHHLEAAQGGKGILLGGPDMVHIFEKDMYQKKFYRGEHELQSSAESV